MEIPLKKLIWLGLAAEAIFRNICLLSTMYVPHMCGNILSSRMGKSGSKSVRCELKNGIFVLPENTVHACAGDKY